VRSCCCAELRKNMIVDLPRKTAIIFALLLCLLLLIELNFRHELNPILLTEHGFIEFFSAITYLIGIFFAIKSVKKSNGLLRAHFLLWTFLAIVFFGEETSWLQHYLQYPTPSFFQVHNIQGELNFHNIDTDDGSMINAYGSGNFNISILFKAQVLFNLGFAIYFLILPLIAFLIPSIHRLIRKFSVPIIGMNTVFLFWIPIGVSVLMAFSGLAIQTYLRNYVGETREMFYAFTIGTFLYLSWRQFPSRPDTI
jgi:hypothetical protein